MASLYQLANTKVAKQLSAPFSEYSIVLALFGDWTINIRKSNEYFTDENLTTVVD